MHRLILTLILGLWLAVGEWGATAEARGPADESHGLEGVPPLPSSFYGTVTVDGANVPEGQAVSAWINGVKRAGAPAFLFEGQSWYALSVPADDPATPLIEGGRPGDTIVFFIGGLRASQMATWRGGTNTRLDLTASGARLFLPLISRRGNQGN